MATRISACGIIDTRPVQPDLPATPMPDTIILIPARLASTRLPGKPLADMHGAADDRRTCCDARKPRESAKSWWRPIPRPLLAAVEKAGGRAVMTRSDHVSGSDRIYEALEALDPEHRIDIVVNVQGDLPTIDPADIRAALEPLDDRAVDIATLAAVITDPAERTQSERRQGFRGRRSRPTACTQKPLPAKTRPAPGRTIIISGSMPIAARRWSVSSSCRPRPTSGARNSSNCARSTPACASMW